MVIDDVLTVGKGDIGEAVEIIQAQGGEVAGALVALGTAWKRCLPWKATMKSTGHIERPDWIFAEGDRK